MKITKIDDISHYKKQDKGVLKQQDKNLSEKEEIKKKVEQRFNAQIKSRVNKEFVKLIKEKRQEEKNFDKFIGELNNINNKKEQEWDLSNVSVEFFKENIKIIKNEKVIEELIIKLLEKGKKDKKSVIEYEEYKKLQKYLEEKHNKIKLFNIKSKKGEKFHNFIMELYSGEEQKWDLSEISIEDITENEKVKLQYKLKDLNRNDEENSSYLYKDNNNNKIYCYIDLIKKILNKNKEEKTREKIINSKEYTELRSHFINYKNIKIDKLTKSLINNKVNIKVVNDIITGQSNREKSLLEFFEEIIKNKEKPILKDKLESIKIENIFDGELIQDIKEIMEKRRESQTEGEIGKLIGEIRGKILSKVRGKIRSGKNDIEKIYMLEIKKYVENNLSYKKEQIKNNKGDKSRGKELYFNFLKKVLFINLDNEIEIKKLKEKIDENFKNVFMQHILDYGKVLYYKEIDDHIKSKNEIETSDLEYIKTKETVIRKMATLVAFATNSFYGIVSNSVEKDVLGRKWTKDDIDKKQLNRFFDINDIKDDEDKIVEFLEMIDFSIYNVRNGVGHFDKMNLGNYDHKYECKKSKIETEIKTKDKNKDLSKNDEIKNYFRKKIDNMENNIKEKFLSNNIYKYYNKESTEQYFKIYRFYLLKSKASFAPNFKRIMKKGKDLYLNQNQNENKQRYKYFYEDNSENNQDEKDKKDTFYNTKRFLLKELYYNNFYEEFLEDRVNFEKIIDNVKRNKENRGKKIEEENKKKRNKSSEEEKFGVAFNNILKYNKEYDIAGYIALVHKKEMERIEKSLRQEKQKDTSGYVRDFIEEIFLEGFIQYLDKNKLEFIAKEIDNKTDNIKNELEDLEINIEDKDKLNETDDILLNLYLFFNMIDGKRLSEFRNELIKYKQFINKRSNINQEFLGIKIEDYELLVEFVILTREKLETDKNDNNTILVDRLYNQENERYKEYDDILEKFIDEDLIRKEYCQEDNKTPIIYSNFEKTKKYFTQTVLEKVQKDYKYTIKDNEELITLEKKDSDNKTLQKQKSDLHIEWEEFKRKKEKHFGKEEKYKKLATNVRRYNYLRNKKELQNVYFLHEILSDILGRNIAFINKWERDFKFLTIAIRKFLNNLEEIKKINNFLDPSNDISNVDDEVYFSVKNYRKYLREISGLHDNLIGLIFLKNAHFQNGISIQNKRYNWIDFRNYIAHFEHLHKGKTNINLIDQVNFLIKLFEYDKKVQNHITKSIKTIIEKYNMEIEFKIDDTKETFEYKIKSLKSKKGKILGKENEFEILEKEFVENIKVLLEYSN